MFLYEKTKAGLDNTGLKDGRKLIIRKVISKHVYVASQYNTMEKLHVHP